MRDLSLLGLVPILDDNGAISGKSLAIIECACPHSSTRSQRSRGDAS